MIVIVLIIAAILWAIGQSKPGSTTLAATSPVINNSTGASLSSALGSTGAPPSYFSTGNPGFSTSGGAGPLSNIGSTYRYGGGQAPAPISVSGGSGVPTVGVVPMGTPVRVLPDSAPTFFKTPLRFTY